MKQWLCIQPKAWCRSTPDLPHQTRAARTPEWLYPCARLRWGRFRGSLAFFCLTEQWWCWQPRQTQHVPLGSSEMRDTHGATWDGLREARVRQGEGRAGVTCQHGAPSKVQLQGSRLHIYRKGFSWPCPEIRSCFKM